MTVYASSNIDMVQVSGADHAHYRTEGEQHMRVACVVCEPELLVMGWVSDPRAVELTYDERLDAESAQADIARFEQMKVAEAARAAADAVRGAAAKPRTTARRGTTR